MNYFLNSLLFKKKIVFCLLQYSINKSNRLIVAVSGGIDSMTLLHVLTTSGFHCHVAHAHFSLRSEADKDAQLVRQKSIDYNIPFSFQQWDTQKYANEKKLSIQMAARQLRYQWFKKLLDEKKGDYVVLAHHANDRLETFLLHTIKGMGPVGLKAIPLKREKFLRPMLRIPKKNIIQYAKYNNIAWNEDKSNKELIYKRNQIRHLIVPLLQKINPSIVTTSIDTLDRMTDLSCFFQEQAEKLQPIYWEKKKEIITIYIRQLHKKKYGLLLLSYWLKKYKFSYRAIVKWWKNPPEVGKKLYSNHKKYMLLSGYIWILKETQIDIT